MPSALPVALAAVPRSIRTVHVAGRPDEEGTMKLTTEQLQRFEREDVLVRDDVGPRGEQLSELHIRRS